MPEYLAPDVYVEEIDTGSKPIEGVSTSTAGMLGVTERGPVDVPILVTSYGEYVRWFGETLDPALFDKHCFLPHAVEGFFGNGGKRLFVVRILQTDLAKFAQTMLFDRNALLGAATSLLAPVSVSPATSTIYVVDNTGLAVTATPTWIQIGDGSSAEFKQITAVPAATHVVLRTGLSFPHANTVFADHIPAATVTAGVADSPQLDKPVLVGAKLITVSGNGAIAAGSVIRLGTAPGDDEYVIADAPPAVAAPAQRDVVLRTPVQFAHAGGAGNNVDIFNAAAFPAAVPAADHQQLTQASTVGADVVFVATPGAFVTAQDYVRITDGNQTEIRRIGTLSALTLPSNAYGTYAAGSTVDLVSLTPEAAPRLLTSDAKASSNVISVGNRVGLNVGDVVQIGLAADSKREFVTIQALPNPQAAPDPGNILLAAPLNWDKTQPSEVRRITAIAKVAAVPPSSIAVPATRGSGSIIVSGGDLITSPSVLRVVTGGTALYHVLNAAPAPVTPTALTVSSPMDLPHASGEPITARAPLISVRALDQGAWGNRLRVAISDNDPPLARSRIRGAPPDSTHMRLDSANGVEKGTVLKRVDASGTVLSVHKVTDINRQSDFLITLDTSLPLPAAAAAGDLVDSHEFQLDVFLMRQPDPAVPTRSDSVLMTESYPQLSMDPRHSRYIQKVIGTTWTPGTTQDDETVPGPNPLRKSDHRSQGLSWLIRVHDEESVPNNKILVRLGPTPLVNPLPGGGTRPARMPLLVGADTISAINDKTYIGKPNVEPELRTGMYALENEQNISIVAVPGQIGPDVQGALITHCEQQRYRFAVLDGPRPPLDSLTEAQAQRQNFDTKYAAFYHPWILIPEPYPANLSKIADYPIPPSGHMVGIYARTDIERGVHKAPANEVVRGIIGLQRRLNKSEHDILNPSPVNINVIRDFRDNSRGIRVYGGRVITSDPDWKYVNVRRLLIFIEASINQGLQWVVFEPNAEPLWARVRRSIANFLTLVWRNGALEGTKVEEAFFVKCDRTTMTQTDIDSGRLICYVGVAPVKPAEFVIVRIGLWTAHADD